MPHKATDTPQWTALGLSSPFEGDRDTLKFKLIESADAVLPKGRQVVPAKAFDFETKSSFAITVPVLAAAAHREKCPSVGDAKVTQDGLA
ncbi:hypothetical protein [Rhizobium leguminosarum]